MDLIRAIIILVFVSLTTQNVWALKRIKRNSSLDSKNRVKEDFVALHTGKQDYAEKANDSKLKDFRTNNNSNNNASFELDKKRNVSSRPLAVILRERERKINDHQLKDHTAAEGGNLVAKPPNEIDLEKKTNILDKRFEAPGNIKEGHKNLQNRHLPHMLHTSRVVGTHLIIPPYPVQQSYGVLNPFTSLDQLMKVGNMMMFKVGVDALPYSPKMLPNSEQLEQQGNFLQQTNEPDFEYIEGPIGDFFNEKALIKSNIPNKYNEKDVIITNPIKLYKPNISENEPKDLVNLMQTALDTLLFNSNKNENESKMNCPLHLEKKSLPNADGDNADVIQVCSCRFIKSDPEQK